MAGSRRNAFGLPSDLRARRFVAGGSTISQQTAKIVYTNQQRTMSRKLTELIQDAGLPADVFPELQEPHEDAV